MGEERLWLPDRLGFVGGDVLIDWLQVPAGLRLKAPKLYFDLERIRASGAAIRVTRGLKQAAALVEGRRALDGGMFHMSMCGSTWAAAIAGAVPRSRIICESPVLNRVLGGWRDDLDHRQRRALLRILVAGLAPPPDSGLYAVKFVSTDVLAFDVVRRAFPAVPFFFLSRDPLEVLVGRLRARGESGSGTDIAAAILEKREERIARSLASLCEAAASAASLRPVEYERLARTMLDEVLPEWGVDSAPQERDLSAALAFHAKDPTRPFQPDGEDKRRAASPDVTSLAERVVGPSYRRLRQRGRGVAARAQ